MDRVNGEDWVDIGSGRRGFRGRDALAGLRGTEVTAAWLNEVQEELAFLAELNDAELGLDRMQVARGIRSQALNYVVAGGTPNALTAVLDPPISDYPNGMPLRVLIASTNTGAATLNLDPILTPRGNPLARGDLPAGCPVPLVRVTGAWRMEMPAYSENAYRTILIKTASYTLTKDDLGCAVIYNGAANATFTLPAPSTVPGGTYHINNNTGAMLTLATASGQIQSGVTAASIPLTTNRSISVTSDGSSWLQGNGGNISNRIVSFQATNYTVSPTDLDRLLVYTGAAAGTFSLPAPSAAYNGWGLTVFNNGSGNLTLSTGGLANIVVVGSSTPTVVLAPSQSLQILSNGADYYAVGGDYAPQITTAISGAIRRPDGVLEQWGVVTSNATIGAGVGVIFPVAYAQIQTATLTPVSGTPAQVGVTYNNTSMSVVSSLASAVHFWRAWGK